MVYKSSAMAVEFMQIYLYSEMCLLHNQLLLKLLYAVAMCLVVFPRQMVLNHSPISIVIVPLNFKVEKLN